jgi:RNA polymerase sigma factor (sigma-70 family)
MRLVGLADPGVVVVAGEDTVDGCVEGAGWWLELYQRRYDGTVRLAGLVVGDFQAGEEIAQDAFARLYEAGQRVRDPDRYLTGTVLNLCRSFVRRAVRGRSTLGRLRHPGASGEFEEAVGDRSVILEALRQLPVRQREAVVLRYYAGVSETELAEMMSVSVGTAKTHLRRGMTKLSEQVETLR